MRGPQDTVRGLATIRERPGATAVLLDLDGTLAPIVPHPEDVRIAAGIRPLLPSLRDRYALVAVVSGRAEGELRRIVDVDGLAYCGNHGLEVRLPDGAPLTVAPPDGAARALRGFREEWTEEVLDPWGVWLEDKGATLTFHYRTAPDPAVAAAALATHVAPAAARAGLVAAPGRMSLEVHPDRAHSKGTAVAALLERFDPVRRALSIGDDRTDVTVWRTFRTLRASGRLDATLALGVRSDETPDEVVAGADVLIDGIPAVRDVLAQLCAPQPPR
jgi:trehalose 6-phosphate phosphatase